MKIIIYRRSSLIGTHGGVEKVVSSLANAFTQDGHQVMIMTRDKRKGKLFYPVNEKVQLVNLFSCIKKKLNPIRTILYKLALTSKYYKKWFEIFPYCDRNLTISKIVAPQIKEFNPDIILSCGIADTVDLCYKQHIDTPIIQMFHSLPTVYFKIKNPHHKQIIFDCLQKTTVAQVLCPSFVENLRPYYSHDIRVIGNPVPQAETWIASHHKKNKHAIIYMARLGPEKQQTLLVRAFAMIAHDFPNWEVWLWGGAKESFRTELQNLIDNLNLTNRIKLCGITAEPYKELAKADICAFPSAYEGFGLGLAEAMTCGLPCVGLQSCSGVNEIIQDKITGFLTQNTPEDFAEKLKELMLSEDLRTKFGLAGRERIKAFAPEEIYNQWEHLLTQLCNKHP